MDKKFCRKHQNISNILYTSISVLLHHARLCFLRWPPSSGQFCVLFFARNLVFLLSSSLLLRYLLHLRRSDNDTLPFQSYRYGFTCARHSWIEYFTLFKVQSYALILRRHLFSYHIILSASTIHALVSISKSCFSEYFKVKRANMEMHIREHFLTSNWIKESDHWESCRVKKRRGQKTGIKTFQLSMQTNQIKNLLKHLREIWWKLITISLHKLITKTQKVLHKGATFFQLP